MINLTANSLQKVKCVLKSFSTEVGGIYGYLNYEKERAVNSMISLVGIEIDFMDDLHPGNCTEAKFKKLWEDYEWENKINVHSKITYPSKYVLAL